MQQMALWGYLESLRSNCGYDEIYFNLAATQTQMNWIEDDHPDITINTPRGQTLTISSAKTHGAIYNYSRAIAINPFSRDAYSFLGNIFLQRQPQYTEKAKMLFRQAVHFFPIEKDFWVNLAYLQIQAREFAEARQSLVQALSIDALYPLTQRNLQVYLRENSAANDPLFEAEKKMLELDSLIAAKNWNQLKSNAEKLVEILPRNFRFRVILGNVYSELKEWSKAEKEYQSAYEMDDSNPALLQNLAIAYRAQNKWEQAKSIIQILVDRNPNDPHYADMLKQFSQIPH